MKTKDGFEVEILGEVGRAVYLYSKEYRSMCVASKYSLDCAVLKVGGIGFVDCESVEEFENIKNTHAYKTWVSILAREGKIARYKEVGISDEWKHFSNFKKFHDTNYHEGFVIDKDLLSGQYSKIYSAETCAYIPPSLNVLIRERSKERKSFKYDELEKCYSFQYSVGGYTRPYIVKAKTLEDICEKYAIYRCTRVMAIYQEYWDKLSDRVKKALVTYYDIQNYMARLYADCTGDVSSIIKQIDKGIRW